MESIFNGDKWDNTFMVSSDTVVNPNTELEEALSKKLKKSGKTDSLLKSAEI